MTLSFSWWYRAFATSLLTAAVEFIYQVYWSLSGMGTVIWKIQPPLDPSWPSHPLQTLLLVSAQQDDSHKTVFPATHLTLFCHASLSDLLCPLHFSVRVFFKVETAHYLSCALLKRSRDYFVSLSTSTCLSLAPPVSQWPKLIPLHSSGTWR